MLLLAIDLGVLAVLSVLALVADLALERLGAVTVPAIGGSRSNTRFALTAAAAGFIALKFLFHIHFSLFGFGFWATVVLAAALVTLAERDARVLTRGAGSLSGAD